MKKIEIELEEATLEKAQWMAKWHHCTLDELMGKAIDEFAVTEAPKYPFIGGWEDEPELVDQMMADIMRDRAAHPLNQRFGQNANTAASVEASIADDTAQFLEQKSGQIAS
ncbi:hypothetical protein [Argonema antarcticum]|uniref:hypothetical protein n=1 Tax=Argonema antarcticum TaxID=2942763 RepID=UPI0020135ABC|nr:hypothetical protein [Argonema antarcticum]MCL1474817.1 hypothetical protein [Argonema antarcticum A004/B2]